MDADVLTEERNMKVTSKQKSSDRKNRNKNKEKKEIYLCAELLDLQELSQLRISC
jgi:hypothetical protein